jgi:quinol---cytochrome c reductase iron-sulfur subunit
MTPGLEPQMPASRRSLAPVLTLVAAAVVAVAAVVAYWAGADTQVFGGLCALSLLLSGAGLAWWAAWGMPDELATEERGELASTPEERAEFATTFVQGGEAITRRRLLIGSVTAILGAYAALGISLMRSLAPDPYSILGHTSWSPDARLMTARGTALKPDDVRIDSVITVYPEGHLADPSAQTVLIRVNPSLLRLPANQRSGVVDGILAFSKVCTHAGCPIGLYQAEQHVFLCPCHESTFDVLRGAVPVSGPATRPLPQLPLKVNDQGFLAARADFSTPVGPSFWNMPTGGE